MNGRRRFLSGTLRRLFDLLEEARQMEELRAHLDDVPAEAFAAILAAVFKRAAMDMKSGTALERREARDFLITSGPLVEELGLCRYDYDDAVDAMCEQYCPAPPTRRGASTLWQVQLEAARA